MTSLRRPWVGYQFDRLDLAAGVLLVILAGYTTAVADLRAASDGLAPGLDLVIDTIAAMVMGSVAVLSWVRYSERRELIALVQAAAFIPLAIAYTTHVIASAVVAPPGTAVDTAIGSDLLYILSAGRLLAAVTLVTGGVVAMQGGRVPRATIVLAAPTAALLVVLIAVRLAGEGLPILVYDLPGGASGVGSATVSTPLNAAVQVLGAALTLTAGEMCRRLWRRDHVLADAYMALGLILASFAQIHDAMYPALEPDHVASSDVLWLAFGSMLLLAIEADARRTLVELRRANENLERLKGAEAERAALEERTKLSRELHDGLAQDLWLAKLKAARLAALPDLGPEASVLSTELSGAIESGLVEARHAVESLRMPGRSASSFRELLVGSVEEFEDRFGVRTELDCPTELPTLAPRTEAELLRIAQEAFSNVARHADATLVNVRVVAGDGHLTLTVRDNGRGFDPDVRPEGSFGLAGMRERAALALGELTIVSHPQDGTAITVDVPVRDEPVGREGGR